MGHTVELKMLGPLEVWRDGELLALGGQRQRSVLACLLLEPDRPVSTDRIVDAIWGERPPSGVLTTLQTYVFRLREVLEPDRPKGAAAAVLVTAPGGYRLDTANLTVDAIQFSRLAAEGRAAAAADPARAATVLSQALGLWRGEVLSDLPDLSNVGPVADRLEQLRLAAYESWVEAELAQGHHDEVLTTLDDLVGRHPLREHLAAQRMLALYRAGRQAEALEAYRSLRRTLDNELGIRPSAEIEGLHQKVLRQDPSLGPVLTSVPSPPAVAHGPRPPSVETPPSEPGLRRRHVSVRSRRGVAAVVAIVVVAIAGLVGLTLAVRQRTLTPLPANSVGPVDALGLRGDAVALNGSPSALVTAGGSLWAVQQNSDAVVKIDPHTRNLVQTVRGVGRQPQAVAASGGDLWVAAFDDNVVTRIDVSTGQVVRKIPVGAEPAALIAGDGGVWVANSGDNTVQHIDPTTEKAGDAVSVGDGPDALALDGTTLWVANGRSGTVTQVDARTGERAAADIPVDAGPAALVVTPTDVWVANEFGQSVSRISRVNGRVQRIDVDDGPSSLLLDDGQLWVTNYNSGTLSTIDVASNRVVTIPVGSAPVASVTVDGEVWSAAAAYGNAEHRGGTLTWTGFHGQPGGIDPSTVFTPDYSNLVRLAYDGLVAFRYGSGRSALSLVPDLATALPEPSNGGRTYVFTIRPDIHYSTGQPLAASDFVRGLRRALLPNAYAPGFFSSLVGVPACLQGNADPRTCDLSKAIDADDSSRRVTLHLTEPDPELFQKLAFMVYPIPADTQTSEDPWWTPPGTGPYQVSKAEPGSITLTRNPYFRQWSSAAQPDGYPDVITYKPAPSEADAISEVLGGRASGTFTNDPLPASVTSRPALIHAYDILEVLYAFPNNSIPPFNDRRVRQALNYAIDRRAIVELSGQNATNAEPTCQILPPSMPGYQRYCPYQFGAATAPYQGPDPTKAHGLVTESGTVGIPIVLHYRTDFPIFEKHARYIATVLQGLGYSVDVQPIPNEHTRPKDPVFDTYQMSFGGWIGDYPLPGNFYDFTASCQGSRFARYCNTDIDAKSQQARSLTQTDPTGSLALWTQVDHMLTDDAALVPLVAGLGAVVVGPTVGNVRVRTSFGPLLDQMWVK